MEGDKEMDQNFGLGTQKEEGEEQEEGLSPLHNS